VNLLQAGREEPFPRSFTQVRATVFLSSVSVTIFVNCKITRTSCIQESRLDQTPTSVSLLLAAN
jgi:hypothetical protein